MRYLIAFLLVLLGCGGSLDDTPVIKSYSDHNLGFMWQSVQHSADCSWLQLFEGQEHQALSFLWESYGNDNTCLIKWMESSARKILVVHLSNGPCLRRGNCSPREDGTELAIAVRAKAVEALTREHCKNCEVYVSPRLEDDFSDRDACRLAKEIKRVTRLKVVRNPNNNTPSQCKYLDATEYHHSDAYGMPCFWSNDGIDVAIDGDVWLDAPTYSETAFLEAMAANNFCTRFVWIAESNCLGKDFGVSPYPFERACVYSRFRELNQWLSRFISH